MVRDRANFNFHQNFKILLDILHRCLWMLTQSHSFISFHLIELQHSMYIYFWNTKVNVWWEIGQILIFIKISKSYWTYSIGVCECWHKVTASYIFPFDRVTALYVHWILEYKVNVWWEIRQILLFIKISKSLWTYSIGVCECWHKVTASYLFVS